MYYIFRKNFFVPKFSPESPDSKGTYDAISSSAIKIRKLASKKKIWKNFEKFFEKKIFFQKFLKLPNSSRKFEIFDFRDGH